MDATQPSRIELVVGVVLARHTVPARVDAWLDVAVVVTALEQGLDAATMARLGRANEVVVADAEASPRLFVQRRDLVDERLRTFPRWRRNCWTFSPCSSVPVTKWTASPSRRCHRANASATTVVYA